MAKEIKITWTDFAIESVEQYATFLEVEKQDIQAAENLVADIFARVEQLYIFPNSGSPEQLLDHKEFDYFFLPIRYYKIIYRIENNNIFITDVFPCKMHPDELKKRTSS